MIRFRLYFFEERISQNWCCVLIKFYQMVHRLFVSLPVMLTLIPWLKYCQGHHHPPLTVYQISQHPCPSWALVLGYSILHSFYRKGSKTLQGFRTPLSPHPPPRFLLFSVQCLLEWIIHKGREGEKKGKMLMFYLNLMLLDLATHYSSFEKLCPFHGWETNCTGWGKIRLQLFVWKVVQ